MGVIRFTWYMYTSCTCTWYIAVHVYKCILMTFPREPRNGFTPFMEAAATGHEIIVQYFLHFVRLL